MQLPLHHLAGGLGAAGSRWGSRARQPPGPACLCPRRLSRPGWVGGALRFLGPPRSGCRSLSPPPLAAPPPAHRSLLSPSLFSGSFASSGPPKGPQPIRASVGPPAARRSAGLGRRPPSPRRPASPRGGKQVSSLPAAPARLPGFLPHPSACRPWVNNSGILLKGKQASMLRRPRPRTDPSGPPTRGSPGLPSQRTSWSS